MDGVALASVITSGVLGVTSTGVAVWTARLTSRTARDTQVRQRRSEAYLELLRLVEREGLWVHHGIDRFEAKAYDRYDYINWTQRPSVPEPPVTDRAAMTALLSAFGTDAVRERHKAWRQSVTDIEEEENTLRWNWEQDGDPEAGIGLDQLQRLLEELRPKELAARSALADAVAAELG
jgi:hypothetical protein